MLSLSNPLQMLFSCIGRASQDPEKSGGRAPQPTDGSIDTISQDDKKQKCRHPSSCISKNNSGVLIFDNNASITCLVSEIEFEGEGKEQAASAKNVEIIY